MGLLILAAANACAQPPDAEVAMVRARIEDTVRDHQTDSFAPELTSEARGAFAAAEAAMRDGDYRFAIERAGAAARLIDEAGREAIQQQARTQRRVARLIRDVELHLAMLDERRSELRDASELARLRESFDLLREQTKEGISDASLLERTWELKQSLLRIESATTTLQRKR